MANLKTAIAAENEILKAVDFTFGYDAAMNNVAVGIQAALSGSDRNFVIGGKVTPYPNGGLNVSIAPIFAFDAATETSVAETAATEPVGFAEADSALDRIDIIEVRPAEEGYDVQSRAFNDPATGAKSYAQVNTKKRIALDVRVKQGAKGSPVAPAADSGYVKVAEVVIPAGTNNITAELIKNIDARKGGAENSEWTADKSATFNPGYLSEIFHTFLEGHNEDGTHGAAAIKKGNIDFGTGTQQVKGADIPSGQSMSVNGADFTSMDVLTDLIKALADNVNALYPHANGLLSRYSFIEKVPAAASTENVDVSAGGPMVVDGIAVTEGQMVFLKDQENAKENGFWEVQSGAWNRFPGFTSANADAFVHKFVRIETGTQAGSVYYIPEDSASIGTDRLGFTRANLASRAKPETLVARDSEGRAEVEPPKGEKDIANRGYVDLCVANVEHLSFGRGRDLLDLIGSRFLAKKNPFAYDENKLILSGGTSIPIYDGEKWRPILLEGDDMEFDPAAALDAGDSLSFGKDYFVYLTVDGARPEIVVSLNSTYPDGSTALTSRKIGGFHVGTIRKVSDDGLWIPIDSVGNKWGSSGTRWEDNVAEGIVPNSVWDLLHRPRVVAPGMAEVQDGVWMGIYIASAEESFSFMDSANNLPIKTGKLVSKYGKIPVTGTEGLSQFNFNEIARRQGMRLPSYVEWLAGAFGSPQGEDGSNTYGWTRTTNTARTYTGCLMNTTTGARDAAGGVKPYAVSAKNLVDCAGNVWEWTGDVSVRVDSGAQWQYYDVLGSKQGQAYLAQEQGLSVLLCGGWWHFGVVCGPRTVGAYGGPWFVWTSVGCRFACDAA